MVKKQSEQEILPWSNVELEKLLRDFIAHGAETSKVDFKSEIETKTQEQKAELLKDISAIANTYDDENYRDYGFLIYGVKPRKIEGISKTEPDTDKFQNHIDQLLREYISPMPQIRIIGFEEPGGKKWGAIVIPPHNVKPYMFFKSLQCRDPRHTKLKGAWFVRRGTTTDFGLPEDLASITQRQIGIILEPLKESIRNIKLRLSKTEEQYNSALFKLVEKTVSLSTGSSFLEKNGALELEISDVVELDLASRLRRKLRTPKDAITEELITQAKSLRGYLDGSQTGLVWDPQPNNVEESRKIIEDIEEKTKPFLLAVATILLNDSKGDYTEALLRALKILAKTVEIPSGTQFNRIGEALRYYPLGLIVYTIFTCGVVMNRDKVLKKVLDIPLKHKEKGRTSHITEIFFYWNSARSLFNDITGQNRCEPIVERVRQIINDCVGETIVEYSEEEFFFQGEFVLMLAYLNLCMERGKDEEYQIPGPGLYIYLHEASKAISDFLFEYPLWLENLYDYPLDRILNMFDRNAHKMASPGCIALGAHDFNTVNDYKEAVKRRSKGKTS
jgi:hypothetical protein